MSDTEIGALRQKLASRVRSDDYRQRRKDMDAAFSQYRIAPDVTVEPVTANGVRAEWRAAKAWSLALDYRLAPEHPFPAAVEDAVAGYRYLLSRGIRPGRIAIGGDSAGGGLVVAAMLAIREAGLAQPACGWCISPWVDMEGIGESMSSKAAADPMVQREGLLEMARLYLNGADPRSPLAAPIYADLRGLAPLLIQVGAAETLLDDAIRLAKGAGAADVRVDLQVWPEMVHVWHLFHPELKAGLRAIEAGAAFVRSMMAG
jgi:acetyl esterase/lipase